MKLYYTDIFELPLPPKHRFPMSKYRLLRERIGREIDSAKNEQSDSRFKNCELVVPDAASDCQLHLAHSPEYVEAVAQGTLEPKAVKRIGFPWSSGMVERSRRSTGATIGAARSAIESGCSVNLAGGTHHAFHSEGEGYCVFNDSCVAARVIQQESSLSRILVVDCDVHQGNGTAAIVADDDSIFSFSVHNQKNFPFRKVDSDLDIPLDDDVADDEYLSRLTEGLEQIEKIFEPEFVFYVSGADPYEGDKLGRLKLTKSGLRKRDETVVGWYRRKSIPVAISMAGGYAENVNDIVDIHFETVCVATEFCN